MPTTTLFSVYYWNYQTGSWVDLETQEPGILDLTNLPQWLSNDPLEHVGSIISYLADQLGQYSGNSSNWKIVGPQGYETPSYLGARYEVRGQESNNPPNHINIH
jgi:hypothetical protein